MKIYPVGQQLLVDPIKQIGERRVGNLIVPAINDMPPVGVLVGATKGLLKEIYEKYELKVGDKIMYTLSVGVQEVNVDGKNFHLVNYSNVLARIEAKMDEFGDSQPPPAGKKTSDIVEASA